MPSPKPPTKPEIKATRKALLAYHSELQKYHEKLVQWETLLTQRNADLIKMREDFEVLVEQSGYDWDDEDDDEECECGPTEALEGCPCETCESWRDMNPAAMRAAGSKFTDTSRRPVPAVAAGDEVQWLESLFTLKDKRRKK